MEFLPRDQRDDSCLWFCDCMHINCFNLLSSVCCLHTRYRLSSWFFVPFPTGCDCFGCCWRPIAAPLCRYFAKQTIKFWSTKNPSHRIIEKSTENSNALGRAKSKNVCKELGSLIGVYYNTNLLFPVDHFAINFIIGTSLQIMHALTHCTWKKKCFQFFFLFITEKWNNNLHSLQKHSAQFLSEYMHKSGSVRCGFCLGLALAVKYWPLLFQSVYEIKIFFSLSFQYFFLQKSHRIWNWFV